MAIGDEENDRAMLEVVGNPVVMENGNPELKKNRQIHHQNKRRIRRCPCYPYVGTVKCLRIENKRHPKSRDETLTSGVFFLIFAKPSNQII